jgi:hypothetical protein
VEQTLYGKVFAQEYQSSLIKYQNCQRNNHMIHDHDPRRLAQKVLEQTLCGKNP